MVAAAAMALGGTAVPVLVSSVSTAQATVRPAAARSGAVPAQLTGAWLPPYPATRPPAATAARPTARRADPLPQVVLPDLFAVAPLGVTAAQFGKLSKLGYVRSLTAVDGGEVKVNGHPVSTIGVNAAIFRSWAPPQTAARQQIWTALARGELMTTAEAATKLGLRAGKRYEISGASRAHITFGGTASFGIPGVDAVVNKRASRSLGLLPGIAVLISAPGADLTRLEARVRGVLGRGTKFVSLRPSKHTVQQERLPVDTQVATGRPSNYLELYRSAAKVYCPGLSWTVLAAIGQIESGDGQNPGPSSAGALGPMQFLPSTWARWGITAFGEPGRPNIMDPYDAVPSAALYLCSYGAAQGGAALSRAIYGYNHAAWYVAEVLALAQEYAREYG